MRRRWVLWVVVLLGGCLGGEGGGPKLPDLELPPAHVGEPYRADLAPAGGEPPLSFAVEGLPPGFALHTPAALLEGTPRAQGAWGIRLAVTDAQGRTDARTYVLELRAEREPGSDGGTDAGTDAGTDGGTDAGTGAGTDGGTDGGTDAGTDGGTDAGTDAGTQPSVPAHLKIANWNVEWFGAPDLGPIDDELQLTNVARVMADLDADIWGLGEIVSSSAFNALLAEASARSSTAYRGLLANSPGVSGGSASYDATEQKVAVVWKEGVLSNVTAEIILSEHDHLFAGRPPLKVQATATVRGVSVPLTLVVVHMKANDDLSSFERRRSAGLALKAWLDARPSTQQVMVLGDWNDDLDVSITHPQDTPYRALLSSSRYTFLTETLTYRGISTTVGYPDPVDHQLVTTSLFQRHVSGSTDVEEPVIPSYGSTTSDHYPVHSTFLLGMSDGGTGGGSDGGGSDGGTGDGGTDGGTDGGAQCHVPRILINEVFPNPGPTFDAPDYDQQYVELYNPGSQSVSLTGWTLHDHDSWSDGLSPRHAFGATTIAAGKSLVVFSGPNGVASHPGIDGVAASNAQGLRLNRTFRSSQGFIDRVLLFDASGQQVDGVEFLDTTLERSNNRDPDTLDCSDVLLLHHDVSHLPRSPGRRADGGAF